ncbi:uncharacterized protein Z518_06376 [Rhinocladiella mackenziei CBS 650.93]|uniref:Synaptobrevin n=1 Tax=Rhinocladiella mackenziei CBS 650.93 TaxID=1442369 RepID=A0A0D2IIF5_9EURO|nr:uncharacterized protein Z518_06376 [Rhinocladiella mackenziei CBS 650.93]KIX05504.1 hypothetical protein Z518_06376 [Rhinocladiella mackenziei CBS 650.93]
MSLTSALRPGGLPFGAGTKRENTPIDSHQPPAQSFQHEVTYLNLHRTLIRFQHLILLTSSSSSGQKTELSSLQRQIQGELWSPLPYHRNKWLHNIEGARTLLLQLERKAQGIRVQRTKYEVIKDLAEKRATIKRLRNRIEEIGREVEMMGTEDWEPPFDDEGDSVFGVLPQQSTSQEVGERPIEAGYDDDTLKEGRPVTHSEEEAEAKAGKGNNDAREELFSSSGARRRRGQGENPNGPDAQTTGFSNRQSTERSLLDSSRVQEDITSSLVSMAAQLKQQGRSIQFALEQDKGILGRAIRGLDLNLSGMEAASKNVAFLRRMSEEEGWFGRAKLYAMIFAMWIVAFLLVFVCPKLRF